jgi:hypothetical protein
MRPIGITSYEAYPNLSIPSRARRRANFEAPPLFTLFYPITASFNSTPPEGAVSRLRRLTAPTHRGALPRTPVSLATRREQGLKAFPCPLLGAFGVPVSIKAKPPHGGRYASLDPALHSELENRSRPRTGHTYGFLRFSISLGQAKRVRPTAKSVRVPCVRDGCKPVQGLCPAVHRDAGSTGSHCIPSSFDEMMF